MSWTCKNCGTENPDGTCLCNGCGELQVGSISLEGPLKRLSFTANAGIGKVHYLRMTGGDEVRRFVDARQYDLLKTEAGWVIQSRDSQTVQRTLVNGTPCTDSPVPLSDGDIIEIGSRKSDKKILPLTVHLTK